MALFRFYLNVAAGVLLLAVGQTSGAAGRLAGSRPNILFILVDDLGYGDMSCHGNRVLKTPNIDAMYQQSVRFVDFHVSPTCAPTRSALMTGRHEFRNGVTHTIFERERLTLEATTLAQVLKAAGYTTGIFGKWHLGDEPDYQPNRRGFDEVFIHGGGGIGQTFPGSCGDAPDNSYFSPVILHNGKFEKTSGYCTDVFFAQAQAWIKAVKRGPFFCYLPLNAVHSPLEVRPEDEARYKNKGLDEKTAKYFGMCANLDDNLGRLLAWLKETGLEKDSLIVFMTDNGGTEGVKVFNAGMRGQKGTPWLGGTRAASFWRWSDWLKPGEVSALAGHIDFFPTIAELAGAKLTSSVAAQVEGRSLVPLLENSQAPWPPRELFTHVGRWPKGADPNSAKYRLCSVRQGRWHLVNASYAGEKKWELFDVVTDPGEKKDLAAEQPEVVKLMDAAYEKWWDSVQPQLVNEHVVGPKANPFKALYWKQFGGGPDKSLRKRMDPATPVDVR